jgi:hypothetical protein
MKSALDSLMEELEAGTQQIPKAPQPAQAEKTVWPPESLDAERRFGQEHAKLFPFRMPPGVRLISWNLKEPPIAIETCTVVTDPARFASTALAQLEAALANPRRWVGWSVPQLLDRLAQVGVTVALGIDKSSELES